MLSRATRHNLFDIILLIVLKGAYVYPHNLYKYGVRADFDDAVEGDKHTLRTCDAFQQRFFAGHDKSVYVGATVENEVANVSHFLAVGDVYNRLFAQFHKRILPCIHMKFYENARANMNCARILRF